MKIDRSKVSVIAFIALSHWFGVTTSCCANAIGGWSESRGGDAAILDGADFAGVRADLATFFPGASLAANSELTSEFLNSVDVLLLDPVKQGNDVSISPLTSAEQAALTSWVAAGGRALIVGENASYFSASRSMIEPFGPLWQNDFLLSLHEAGTVTDNTSYSEITDGPYGKVTSFTGGAVSYFSSPAPATSLGVWNVNGKTALAAMKFGAGRVVFFGDNALLYDYGATNNVSLRRNTLDYLIVPEPSALLLFALALLGLAVFHLSQVPRRRFALISAAHVCAFGIALSCQHVMAAVPITAGLVANWDADGNANDSSGNGHHGALIGGGYSTGRFGQAFDLTGGGTRHVAIPDAPQLDGFSAATWSAWVNLSSLDATTSFFDKRTNHLTNNAYSIGFRYSSLIFGSDLGIEVGNEAGGWSSQGGAVANELTIETWHHIAFTYDSNAAQNYAVYIDGVLRTATKNTNRNGPLFNSSAGLTLGAPNNASGGTFNGLMDELAIYNRALSPDEIQRLATVPEPHALVPWLLGTIGAAVYFWNLRRKATPIIFRLLVVTATSLLGSFRAPANVVVHGFLDGEFGPTNDITSLGVYENSGVDFRGDYHTTVNTVVAGDWSIGITTSVAWNGVGFGLREAWARVEVQKEGELQLRPGAPFPSQLRINGQLTGTVFIENAPDSFHDGAVSIGNLTVSDLDDLFFIGDGTYHVMRNWSVLVPVSEIGRYPTSFWLKSESYADSGVVLSEFSTTLKITSITLPNGNTPEFEGWQMSFSDASMSPNFLGGDYNQNGSVDAADYAVWRDSNRTQNEYEIWRENFGRSSASGTGFTANDIPEPASICLAMTFLAFFAAQCSRDLGHRGGRS